MDRPASRFRRLLPFVTAFLVVTLGTLATLRLSHSSADAIAATMYLLVIVISGARYGLAEALFVAALTSLCWTFFFLPPIDSFGIELEEVVPVSVFFMVAIGTAVLTSAVRRQRDEAEARERQLELVLALTMDVLAHPGIEDALAVLAEKVGDRASCSFILVDTEGPPRVVVGPLVLDEPHLERIREALTQPDLAPQEGGGKTALYLPLGVADERFGVMVVEWRPGMETDDPLLVTIAQHAALALQRYRLEQAAGEAMGKLEAERLKASLLASVSHDLRTPLASIKAAATGIALEDGKTDEVSRAALVRSIIGNADRLDRLVGNLLNMSRLEAGAWKPSKELFPVSEILAGVLGRLDDSDAARVEVDMPEGLPLVALDGQQIEQVLWNLFENALKYAPASMLHLHVRCSGGRLEISLRDHGNGIPVGEERRIFQKFYRAHRGGERGAPGVGMGLAICKQIVEAHDGEIHAANAPDGGAVFAFALPIGEVEQSNASRHEVGPDC